MLTVISMSKGCAEPCHKNPKSSTKRLFHLQGLLEEGAVLAISRELFNEIKSTCDSFGDSRHSQQILGAIRLAENKGNLWKQDDLPVFVEDGINTQAFATIDMVFIQLFEAQSSEQWMEYLRIGQFELDEGVVSVQRLDALDSNMIVKERFVKKGETFENIAKLLTIPMMWSQRIILYDVYALKNSMKFKSGNSDMISGLDRFLEHLVKVRKECDEPLHELTLITHPSPKQGKRYVNIEEQLSGMHELCAHHDLHKWVKKITLRITGQKSEGERYIVFEYSQSTQCFEFGKKGLQSIDGKNPDGEILQQFVIKGPLEKKEWMPFKDKLKTFNKHVIESTI